MRLGKRGSQPAEKPVCINRAVRDLHQHFDLILDGVPRKEMNAELIHLIELPDDGLDSAWIDVRPADQLHVVHPAAYAALVDIECPAAGAFAGRDSHDQVPRQVAQKGNEAASQKCEKEL